MGTPAQQRRTIDEVEPVYLAMMEEIQGVLTDRFGVGEWVQRREQVQGSACDEVADGERRSYNLGTAARVAEEEWDQALGAVESIAGEHGFTERVEIVDAEGDHLVDLNHADGGRLSFGTQEATVLRVTTGCHPAGAATAAGG